MLYTIDQNDHCYKMCERFLTLPPKKDCRVNSRHQKAGMTTKWKFKMIHIEGIISMIGITILLLLADKL